MTTAQILASIPTYTSIPSVATWAEQQAAALLSATLSQSQRDSFVAINAADLPPHDQTLLADWTSYSVPADRVEYPRLCNVINTFPQGFRSWFCKTAEDRYTPVAYTGWYPLSKDIFDKVYDHPESITHRRELLPQSALLAEGDYLWLFNYSILKPLRKSEQSRKMLQTYAADIMDINPRGLVAAVLSEESKPVVRRFGMRHVGNMTHTGVSEEIWATRTPTSRLG